MSNYNFYVSKTISAPIIGKFVTEETTGKTYAILHSSPKLKRGKLLIAKEYNENGETGHIERYYITNIIPVHSTHPIKKVKIHLETESEHINNQMKFRHDWKITIFNVIGGSLAGLITSLLFWLITT